MFKCCQNSKFSKIFCLAASRKLCDWAWKCSESLSEPLKGCDFLKFSASRQALWLSLKRLRIALNAFEGLLFSKNNLPGGKLCDWAWKCSESLSEPWPLKGCDFPKYSASRQAWAYNMVSVAFQHRKVRLHFSHRRLLNFQFQTYFDLHAFICFENGWKI